MNMLWIVLLGLLGLVLLFAELVLLPGITIAAVGAFLCFVGSTSWAFSSFGLGAGFIVLFANLILIGVTLAIFLRPKTWKKVALNTQIDNAYDDAINTKVELGAQGVTLTRLAPMGKVVINGATYEAKSTADYINQQTKIEVVGYENFSLIVNPIK